MIPKVIHYCWFGNNPLDDTAKKCINSWRNFFPNYQIRCWNEENFDICQIDFMKDAYEKGKWAFVSDVARILVIYKYGGVYFDTDVEVVAPYDDIFSEAPKGYLGCEFSGQINTGLGFAAEQGDPFLAELIKEYKGLDFNKHEKDLSAITCPVITTKLMEQKGFKSSGTKQGFQDYIVYPEEYFSPMNYETGKMCITSHTHSIHWYGASWQTDEEREYHLKEQKLKRLFGDRLGDRLAGMSSSIGREGFLPYVKRHFKNGQDD